MFEKHKAAHAAKVQAAALEDWQTQRNACAALLEFVQTFRGSTSSEIMLANGEALFYKVTGCSLVEERRGPGHYEGVSQGLSVPVFSVGGHSVRYRVGASRGNFIQGAPSPTAIDIGTMFVTNQRVVFMGKNQTRECAFAKTIGISHNEAVGETSIAVSNRQKSTIIHAGPAIAAGVNFRIELALAYHQGTVPQLVSTLTAQLAELDARRPGGPVPQGSPLPAPPEPELPRHPEVPDRMFLPPDSPQPVIPPEDHDPGWEYLYFATELARGIAATQPRYLVYQSQLAEAPGALVADPKEPLQSLLGMLSAVWSHVDAILTTEALARAFGPPGEPGSEEEIRLVTASLCAVYAGLVEWGIRVRNVTVDPLWEPAVDALAQMVGLPLHQFQDFSAATTAGLSRAIASVRSAKPKEPIKLDFVLKLTTDPTVMAALDAAMGAIKAAQ